MTSCRSKAHTTYCSLCTRRWCQYIRAFRPIPTHYELYPSSQLLFYVSTLECQKKNYSLRFSPRGPCRQSVALLALIVFLSQPQGPSISQPPSMVRLLSQPALSPRLFSCCRKFTYCFTAHMHEISKYFLSTENQE